MYQELFNHMVENHRLTLTEDEMNDIVTACRLAESKEAHDQAERARDAETKLSRIRRAVVDAMDTLTNLTIGGIGSDGPTLKELNNYVNTHGSAWEGEQDYHTVQAAWRTLERGLGK